MSSGRSSTRSSADSDDSEKDRSTEADEGAGGVFSSAVLEFREGAKVAESLGMCGKIEGKGEEESNQIAEWFTNATRMLKPYPRLIALPSLIPALHKNFRDHADARAAYDLALASSSYKTAVEAGNFKAAWAAFEAIMKGHKQVTDEELEDQIWHGKCRQNWASAGVFQLETAVEFALRFLQLLETLESREMLGPTPAMAATIFVGRLQHDVRSWVKAQETLKQELNIQKIAEKIKDNYESGVEYPRQTKLLKSKHRQTSTVNQIGGSSKGEGAHGCWFCGKSGHSRDACKYLKFIKQLCDESKDGNSSSPLKLIQQIQTQITELQQTTARVADSTAYPKTDMPKGVAQYSEQ